MKRKSFDILNTAVFLSIIFITGLILFTLPRSEFSESEKRKLEEFPEFSREAFFSGEYTRQINFYFSDTVPFRENITEASSRIKNKMGFQIDGVTLHNVVINDKNSENITPIPEIREETIHNLSEETENEDINKNNDINQNDFFPSITGEVTNEKSGEISPETTSEKEDGKADIGNNGILVYKNRGLMLYGGSKEQGERYAAALNAYRDALADGVNVYSMLIPTSVEFYCPVNYRNLSGNQREDINNITSKLDNGITAVNVYSVLSSKTEEDIYFKTDHHWSPLGAHYAATRFCSAAGVGYLELPDYEKVVIPGYVGTLFGYSGDINLKNNPEDFIYYKPQNNYSTTYYNFDNPAEAIKSALFLEQSVGMSYCIFMGGDAKITHIETDVKNGRILAVFKDSYGNALVPFLVNSFEEIYVIDIRYFPYKSVDYLKQNNVTDVLFCNNIFAANTGSMIACIEDIM